MIGLGAFQVQQQVEMLEAALNAISIDYEGANKYKVKDAVGKDMRRPGAATGSARARVPTSVRRYWLGSVAGDVALMAVGVVVTLVAVAAFGWMDISMAALAGAVLLVLLGCLRLEEFWSAIHWDIIFLLAGIIPVGIALEKTGAAALLAERLVGVGGFLPPIAFLVLLFLLTTLITELVSNNASVVLLLPIVIAAAVALGLDPRPVSLVVMLAASTSMMTPIGYQTNTMIYGPGNYRFADFARAGGPLNLILAVVIPLAVAWRFPL